MEAYIIILNLIQNYLLNTLQSTSSRAQDQFLIYFMCASLSECFHAGRPKLTSEKVHKSLKPFLLVSMPCGFLKEDFLATNSKHSHLLSSFGCSPKTGHSSAQDGANFKLRLFQNARRIPNAQPSELFKHH